MRSRNLIIVTIIMILIIGFNIPGNATSIKLDLENGKNSITKDNIYVKDGKMMVGIRDVVDLLGGEIVWDETKKTLLIDEEDNKIVLDLDDSYTDVNGSLERTDQLVEIKDGVTFVPIRFISENLGYYVNWDAKKNVVQLSKDYRLGYEDLTKKERELAKLVNEYRRQQGLPVLSVSKSLTKVARIHTHDLQNNYRDIYDNRGMKGNMHSWSNKGYWKPVIYTPDHKYKELMWSKPRELTNYKGNGYEISYWNSEKALPKDALSGWKGSSSHNEMIVGRNGWDEIKTMGVGIYKNYATIWFGEEGDPQGYHIVK